MTARRNISRASATGDDAVLAIRCKGRRIAVVYGPGGDGSYAVLFVTPRDGRSGGGGNLSRASEWAFLRQQALEGYEAASAPHDGAAACPNHAPGHRIDAARLARVVDLECRPGKEKSVDIARVEVAAH